MNLLLPHQLTRPYFRISSKSDTIQTWRKGCDLLVGASRSNTASGQESLSPANNTSGWCPMSTMLKFICRFFIALASLALESFDCPDDYKAADDPKAAQHLPTIRPT